MTVLLKIAAVIDRVNGLIGRCLAWLVVAAIVVSAGNAILRKTLNMSSNAWLEAQWYLFGAVFMLCAAWTLRDDEHVRVDVVSSMLSPRSRVVVDLVCHILFLVPFAVVMVYLSWPFFVTSFLSGEQSGDAGGLIRWPAKFFILAGFVLLLVQAVSEIIKCCGKLSGAIPLPPDTPPDNPVVEEAGIATEGRGAGA
ncbi:TRAP-type mannitol/chloroaromatic compound transport system, small permease component [Loktanella atrilutea]|uniref:TRAP transporter small permease protein n=1 Tax=Loktanella atrilutea TaxID=366533 RepID=A0A1M4VD56_LOKAT|nr:TRAP transporter small permease subunit [Loktanella atrilutea]SHE66855.1 TRAP-type mannitol/chloroaromatic compound transport system, small permease component [Loktanella atrilutea]